MDAPLAQDEDKRLAALQSLNILDTPPELRFDRVTRLATRLFKVPIALVSLIDADRQWFKSSQGLTVSETPRAISFCGHAICGEELFHIPNAEHDPRFKDNPLVTGEPMIRFYAGHPLTGPGGYKLGTLCLIDRQPREMNPEDRETLKDLASLVADELGNVELNRTAMALKSREAELGSFLENAHDMVQSVGSDGRIVYVNSSWRKIMGYSEDEIAQLNLMQVIHPDSQAHCMAVFEQILSGKAAVEVEAVFLSKTGKNIVVSGNAQLRKQADGTLITQSIFRDITFRKQYETSMRRAREHLERRVLERTRDLQEINTALEQEVVVRKKIEALQAGRSLVLEKLAAGEDKKEILETLVRVLEEQVSGMKGSILLLDHEGKRLLNGASPNLPEAYSREIEGLAIGPKVGSCGTAAFEKRRVIVADTQSDLLWADYRVLAAQHHLRACWSHPIIGADGGVMGTFALYYHDVRMPSKVETDLIEETVHLAAIIIQKIKADQVLETLNRELEGRVKERTAVLNETNSALEAEMAERRRSEELIKAKNEELKAFAYTVSHDLKAPLRGISGYAQELLSEHHESLIERPKFCLEQIARATNHLDKLIEDLLQYSRLDREMPKSKDVNLNVLVKEIIEARASLIQDQGIEVTIDIPFSVVQCWEKGMSQVLSNLIDNGLKYSRKAKPPRIAISGETCSKVYRICVRDNGIGFNMKYHDRIYGLFNRLVRQDEYEGTGAGLAIVKKVIDGLRGKVWAESIPGQGAAFYVEWPKENYQQENG